MRKVRLNTLVSVIPNCDLLADVGCDHGYVGIQALILGKAKRVVFTDISQASLAKAQANCPLEFADVATFVCQDGLGALKPDVALIAGMGGLEIVSILRKAHYMPSGLVLQPMRNQRDVRKYLSAHYEIVTDVKFCDGKYYDVIVARRSEHATPLTELQLEFGVSNLRTPSKDFVNYLQLELSKLNGILLGTDDAEVVARRELIERALNEATKSYNSANS